VQTNLISFTTSQYRHTSFLFFPKQIAQLGLLAVQILFGDLCIELPDGFQVLGRVQALQGRHVGAQQGDALSIQVSCVSISASPDVANGQMAIVNRKFPLEIHAQVELEIVELGG
jgi:hypothetical protein